MQSAASPPCKTISWRQPKTGQDPMLSTDALHYMDVGDLLELAQADLIAHRPTSALRKLEHAVTLRSSLACETLATLLAKTSLDHRNPGFYPTPGFITTPPSERSFAITSYFSPRASAKAPSSASPTSPGPERIRNLSSSMHTPGSLYILGLEIEIAKPLRLASVGVESGEGVAAGAEGNTFDISRVLDLTIGLLDQYRYGHLTVEDSSANDASLWSQGHRMARALILHPAVTSTRISNIVLARDSESSDPSTKSPPLTCRDPLFTSTAQQKLKTTLQVHLLYLLALQTWFNDETRAEAFWREIAAVSAEHGGSIGTKIGDHIVAKASKRLDHDSCFQSWKDGNKKRASPVSFCSSPPSPPSSTADRLERVSLNFPLVHLLTELGTTSTPKLPDPALHCDLRRTNYSSPPASDVDSPLPSRISHVANARRLPRRIDSGVSMDPAKPSLRRVASSASMAFNPPRILRRVASSALISSPSLSDFSSKGSDHSAQKPLRSSGSVESAAAPSQTVVPPMRSSWIGTLRRKVSNFALSTYKQSPVAPTSSARSPAVSLLRQVLQKDDTALNSAIMWEDSDLLEDEYASSTWTPPESPVLKRDLSRERSLLTRHRSYVTLAVAAEAAQLESKSKSEAGPSAREMPVSPIICTVTPPTPTKEHLLPPRAPRRSRSSKSLRRSSISKLASTVGRNLPQMTVIAPIDPFLLELERKSRMGVKTTCDACGVLGANFPACPRCDKHYCGRSCRVGTKGKHVC